jgi:hypothetical protein
MRVIKLLIALNKLDAVLIVNSDELLTEYLCCRYDYSNVISKIRDIDVTSMLGVACKHGAIGVVKHLVSAGTDIHSYSDYAVRCASAHGHLELVRYLVSVGANIHAVDDIVVGWASTNGHIEVVKYLESLKN